MEQKQAIWCLKRKFLNINLLFIELFYKINITFVIILIFEEKNGTLHVILTVWNDIFESVRVKIWHGRTCASAWSALLQSARAASRSTL